MTRSLLHALEDAEHEQVQIVQDPAIGLWAVLAVHSTAHGPAFGGIRRFPYRGRAAAMADVLRLSEAMTLKCMMARVPGGGGKGVVLDHPDLDAPAAYRHLGRFVENMGGRMYTGPDLGTGPEELAYLSETTRFVTLIGPRGPGNLAAATARGVVAGLRAVVGFRRGAKGPARDLSDASFAVQGLGEVGYLVAGSIAAAGGRVIATDEQSSVLERAVERLGVEAVEPGGIINVECDVFVPCAVGGIVHDLTIERMRCKAIAGSANNVLAAPAHARRLARRGILVAPDYVINSGALILGANFHLTGNRDQAEAIDRIGDELFELFERAAGEGISPPELADRIARERLAELAHDQRFFFPNGPSQ